MARAPTIEPIVIEQGVVYPPSANAPGASGGTSPPATTPDATVPTAPTDSLGDELGKLLLEQLKQGGSTGNLGTEEIPISTPSKGPNALLIVGGLAIVVVLVWLFTKKKEST